MEQRINILKETEKVVITISLEKGKGYGFVKKLVKKLTDEKIQFKVPFHGRSSIIEFNNEMYIKVYCPKYEPAELTISTHKLTEESNKILDIVLSEAKELYVDSPKNSIYLAHYSKVRTKNKDLNLKLQFGKNIIEEKEDFFNIPVKVGCNIEVIDSNSRSSKMRTTYTETVKVNKGLYSFIPMIVTNVKRNKEEFIDSLVVED